MKKILTLIFCFIIAPAFASSLEAVMQSETEYFEAYQSIDLASLLKVPRNIDGQAEISYISYVGYDVEVEVSILEKDYNELTRQNLPLDEEKVIKAHKSLPLEVGWRSSISF